MKIIDLLNKIANDEEVPKKIKWENIIFAYSEYDKDYLEFPFSEEEYQGLFCMKDSILTRFLDDEVEILDDEEKGVPEKIRHDACWIYDDENNQLEKITLKDDLILNKLDEIIDYLEKQMKGE